MPHCGGGRRRRFRAARRDVRVGRAQCRERADQHSRGHRLDRHAAADDPERRTANVPVPTSSRASRSATPGPTSQQSRHSSNCRQVCVGAPTDRTRARTAPADTVCQALGSSPTSTTPPQESAWGWNVVADAPGSYTVKAQIVESSTSDPDAADNSTTVTVVVTQLRHRHRRLHRRRQGAGQAVTREAEGGVARLSDRARHSWRHTDQAHGCRMHRFARGCQGQGHPEGCLGDCVLPLPHFEIREGKTLRGTMSFSARGTKFTKSFAAKLGQSLAPAAWPSR